MRFAGRPGEVWPEDLKVCKGLLFDRGIRSVQSSREG